MNGCREIMKDESSLTIDQADEICLEMKHRIQELPTPFRKNYSEKALTPWLVINIIECYKGLKMKL